MAGHERGHVFPTEPIFARYDGGFWTLTDYQNWRRRVYRPVAAALGLPAQPYALRHSFVSLLIQEGRDFREVARLAGHGPEVCARTYAHLFDEWDGAARIGAEDAIRAARNRRHPPRADPDAPACVPESFPSGAGPGGRDGNARRPRDTKARCGAGLGRVGDPGFEPGTSSLSEKRSNRLS